MKHSILLLINLMLVSSEIFACDENQCPQSWIGNGICSYSCNTAPCNFDSPFDSLSLIPRLFEFSDCYSDCFSYTSCAIADLGNGQCDDSCNNLSCGWDLGDCGFCSQNCTLALLSNNVCDQICENQACMFDNNACGWCAIGCFLEDLYADTCIPECNGAECAPYGNNPCFPDYSPECSPGCTSTLLYNDYCDEVCNTPECFYDYDLCLCSLGCTPEIMQEGYCEGETDPCATPECNLKNGLCGTCALLCTDSMLGDGVCDAECNNSECNFDYLDCGCAPGCASIYTAENGWDWDTSGTEYCLVPACEYNYGVGFSDPFVAREYILTQIISGNWKINALVSHPDCADTDLESFDAGTDCEMRNACNNEAGMYCMGMVASSLTGCLRNNGNQCLVCEGLMIMEVCTSLITECPDGYQSQPAIVQLFDSTSTSNLFCLRSPEVFSPYNYKEYYVTPYYPPLSIGTGTIYDPFFSLYFAFTQFYASFTTITLWAGYHYYQADLLLITPLITNKLDPLNINSSLDYFELWILGDPSLTTVVYWYGKLTISSKAYKTFIKDIIFNGSQILRNNCTGYMDYCYYCPIITISGSSITTDQGEYLTLDDYYNIPNNCSLYSDHILFSFTYSAFFENVDFSWFRHQFNALVFAVGALNLTNVDFIRNQAMAGGSIINLDCTENCETADFGYINGVVVDSNYGYEHSQYIEVGSFFTSNKCNSAYFQGVSFIYNFALCYQESAYSAYIISISESTGTTAVVDCIFYANYVNSLIFIDEESLIYSNLNPNYWGISQAFSQTHFSLINTAFTNIYSSLDLITYLMKKTVHNFLISDITITNVYSGGSGIISIQNLGTLKAKDTLGAEVTVLINGVNTQVLIPPRTITIQNLSITTCSTGLEVLSITQMPAVVITNLIIYDIYDGDLNSLYLVIQYFIAAGKYLSLLPAADEVASLTCSGITSLSNVYSVNIDTVYISFTSCYWLSGPAGLQLREITTDSSISNVVVHDILSWSKGANAIFVENMYGKLSLRSILLYNIYGNAIELGLINDITITDLSAYNLCSMDRYSSPISMEQGYSLTIKNSQFANMISNDLSGGGSFSIISNAYAVRNYIIISNCTITNSTSRYGSGGGFNLDSASSLAATVYVSDIVFSDCNAPDGSAFSLSTRVGLYISLFINLLITECTADVGGTISDYHTSGILDLRNIEMHSNSALYAGLLGQYSPSLNGGYLNEYLLYVYNLTISMCYSGDFVVRFSSIGTYPTIVLEKIVIHDNFSSGGLFASAIAMVYVECFVSDISVFNMNIGFQADILVYLDVSYCTFANLSGYFAVVKSEVLFCCNYCDVSFVNTTLVKATTNSIVMLDNSVFHQNNVTYGFSGLILIEIASLYTSYLTNCSFINNTANMGDILDFSYTKLVITSCTFRNNFPKNSDYTVIYPIFTSLIISDSVFSNPKATEGSFLYLVDTTSSISSTSFSNGSSKYGGAIVVVTSSLNLTSCIFEENQSTISGGHIYALNTVLFIKNSTFASGLSPLGDSIFLDSCSSYISSSQFTRSMTNGVLPTGSIYAIGQGTMLLTASVFSESISRVSGLIAQGLYYVEISDSLFQDFSGITYGAVACIGDGSGQVKIFHSKFLNNYSTDSGGGATIIGMGLSLQESLIQGNHAQTHGGGLHFLALSNETVTINSTLFLSNTAGGDGGGLCLQGNAAFLQNTTVQANSAKGDGGGGYIAAGGEGEVTITRCAFLDNNCMGSGGGLYLQNMGVALEEARVDGNYGGVDGGGLHLLSPDCNHCTFNLSGLTEVLDNRCDRNGGGIMWKDCMPQVSSTVVIKDNKAVYGADIASSPSNLMPFIRRNLKEYPNFRIFNAAPGESYSRVFYISLCDIYGNVVTTDNSSTLSIFAMQEYPDLSLRGNITFTSVQGVFSVTNFVPLSNPGSIQQFQATTDAIPLAGVRNSNTTYINTVQIEIALRNCTYGEKISNTQCTPCAEGTYVIDPDYTCHACPTGGYCPGGSLILPLPGYWRSSNYSNVVYPCTNPQVCLGNTTETDYMGGCSEGYYGILCEICAAGYTNAGNGYCSACPSLGSNIAISLAILVFITFGCTMLIITTIKSAFYPKKMYSIYIKIFTNYIQLQFLTATFNFNWPAYVLQFLNVQQQPTNQINVLFSLDCYMFSKSQTTVEDSYYYKLVFVAVAPLIIFAGSLIAWLGIGLVQDNYSYLKRGHFNLTLIILFFLIFPSINTTNFTHFHCDDINIIGSYLSVNYSVKCWDQRYIQYALFVVTPSIIMWTLAVPAFILILMIKRQRFLNREKNRLIFGFLFNGFRKVRFYWEFVILYRKVVIIAISVFMYSVSLSVQALTILSVLTASSFFHYKLKPYRSVELNAMENEAMITATLTLYCGLFYLTNDIGSIFQVLLFIAMVIGNTYFLFHWLYWMGIAIGDIIIQHLPRLRHLLKRGDAYDIEFFQEPIHRPGSYYEETEGVRLHTFLRHQPQKPAEFFAISSMNSLFREAMLEEQSEWEVETERRYQKICTLRLIEEEKESIDNSLCEELPGTSVSCRESRTCLNSIDVQIAIERGEEKIVSQSDSGYIELGERESKDSDSSYIELVENRIGMVEAMDLEMVRTQVESFDVESAVSSNLLQYQVLTIEHKD